MQVPLIAGVESKKTIALSSDRLYNNFLLFSTSFSLVHATVDGVLVYATAELGPLLGGVSGGLLYICYACSSLFLAKNILHQLKARRAVLFGMVCLLTYVSTFLVALAVPDIKWEVCIFGSIAGGFGAGIMWTAQGSYYALNSSLYFLASSNDTDSATEHVTSNKSTILNKFAAYFAGIYLCSEAVCKVLVTGLFLVFSGGDSDDDDDNNDTAGNIGSWQVIAFLVFTLVAWTATACSFWILDLSTIKHEFETEMARASLLKANDFPNMYVKSESDNSSDCTPSISREESCTEITIPTSGMQLSLIASFSKDFSAVLSFIKDHESFRYLLPYQFAFGFSSTYMGFLVYGIILNDNGKEGYIGLLSALSVLFAGGLTVPVATYTNRKGGTEGSITTVHAVMLTGAGIFMGCSVFPLFMSEETIASWPVILPLVCTYGAGRSIWENSNKALIADLFTTVDAAVDHDIDAGVSILFRGSMSSINECADEEKTPMESCHERAFAAIYFTSGVGAAIGFFIFKFLSTNIIAASTLGVGFLALLCNHYFFTYCHGNS